MTSITLYHGSRINGRNRAGPFPFSAIYEGTNTEKCSFFTVKGLDKAVLSMKDKEALEPDGIMCEMLKFLCKYKPDLAYTTHV